MRRDWKSATWAFQADVRDAAICFAFVVRGGDRKKSRVFVVVSRQALIDSQFSTVVCAPIYTRRDGLATQVDVGVGESLKHDSSIHCDALVSMPKPLLTDYVDRLGPERLRALDLALRVALALA